MPRAHREGFGSINESTREETIQNAILYGRFMIAGEAFYILQNAFQSFFSVAEKPGIGFLFTLLAGLTNMVLDYLLIIVFHLGIPGAAMASLLGIGVGSIGPFLYFLFDKNC